MKRYAGEFNVRNLRNGYDGIYRRASQGSGMARGGAVTAQRHVCKVSAKTSPH
jgi:hypothetical protein